MSHLLSLLPPFTDSPLAGGSPTPDPGPETARSAGCSECGHSAMKHGIGGCYQRIGNLEICTCPRGAAEIVRGAR